MKSVAKLMFVPVVLSLALLLTPAPGAAEQGVNAAAALTELSLKFAD